MDRRDAIEAPARRRAAEYVRMSTEHQKYSTENQAETIKRYADAKGIEIVRTYADHGKSGLRLDGRDALKRLIDDVRNRRVNFEAVLVYDVSRWGRFQDADESAYYEFLCKEAGIAIHYCAEQFENDGSLSATIIKSMKRAMAGEYSRELSVKVFAGQCRLINLGFRQGGLAGFGLRRLLVDEHRQPKGPLAIGTQKSLQTDRVVLAAGPPEEVAIVQRMYRLFGDEHLSEKDIAERLNGEGVLTDLGRPWTRGTVYQVLTNEKYIGNNVYNRISFKLKRKRVVNPPDMWIRAPRAFDPVVDVDLFTKVQRRIEERCQRFSDEEMLNRLAALWRTTGRLSAFVIDAAEEMPSSAAYRSRFGTLLRAYRLVGYSPSRDYQYLSINKALRSLHPEVVHSAIQAIERGGGWVEQDARTDLLTINGEFTVSIVISRSMTVASGALRWNVRLDGSLRPDITVAVRMDAGNSAPLDFYILPRRHLAAAALRLREDNGVSLDAFRFESLDMFWPMAGRMSLEEVA